MDTSNVVGTVISVTGSSDSRLVVDDCWLSSLPVVVDKQPAFPPPFVCTAVMTQQRGRAPQRVPAPHQTFSGRGNPPLFEGEGPSILLVCASIGELLRAGYA